MTTNPNPNPPAPTPVATAKPAPAPVRAGNGWAKSTEEGLVARGFNAVRAKADLAALDAKFEGEHGHIPHQVMVNWVTAHFSSDHLQALALELGQRWEDELAGALPADRAWERDPNGKRPERTRRGSYLDADRDGVRDHKGRLVDGADRDRINPVTTEVDGERRRTGSAGAFVDRRKTDYGFGGTFDRRRTGDSVEAAPAGVVPDAGRMVPTPPVGRPVPTTLDRDPKGIPVNPSLSPTEKPAPGPNTETKK